MVVIVFIFVQTDDSENINCFIDGLFIEWVHATPTLVANES